MKKNTKTITIDYTAISNKIPEVELFEIWVRDVYLNKLNWFKRLIRKIKSWF